MTSNYWRGHHHIIQWSHPPNTQLLISVSLVGISFSRKKKGLKIQRQRYWLSWLWYDTILRISKALTQYYSDLVRWAAWVSVLMYISPSRRTHLPLFQFSWVCCCYRTNIAVFLHSTTLFTANSNLWPNTTRIWSGELIGCLSLCAYPLPDVIN